MTRLLGEDLPFLDGTARFTADVPAPGALVVRFVRSAVAHGILHSIDATAARSVPGVHAVLTNDDLDVPPFSFFPQLDWGFARPLLAARRVRFAGEPVAIVVADTAALAEDAGELVELNIEPLPALIDPWEAAERTSAVLHPAVGTNVVLRTTQEPDGEPLAGAAVVISRRYHSPRLSPLPLETSAIVVTPSTTAGVAILDVWAACQGVHAVQADIAAALGLSPDRVRVRAPSVGGGFGARYRPPLEYLTVAAAALLLGRPLRWSEDRTEQLLGQPHGRGHHLDVQLGLTAEGTFTGIRVRGVAEAGAYPHQAPFLVEYTRKMAPGPYRMPVVDFAVETVVTNTAPVGAYRGAGQPEIVTAVEQAIDEAARRLAMDPVELRRRNMLSPDELPHTTVTGVTYDSGDFPAALGLAVELIDMAAQRDRQRRQRTDGSRLRTGVGVSSYTQIAAVGRLSMRGQLAVTTEGSIIAGAGSHSHGQGHRSTFAAMLAPRLGVEPADIAWVDADTSAVTAGHGTGGSRSAALSGNAVIAAADRLVERARHLVAQHLEADPADVVISHGGLGVVGVPVSTLPWAEVASLAGPGGLLEIVDDEPGPPNTPYGTHACVVEVDLDTGGVVVVAHVAVDDCGARLAPELVAGQQHGGAVAGLAQALGEQIVYDLDGTPRTTSLVDYQLPAASEVPSIVAAGPQVPAATNALGVRGIGENGAIAATAAVCNAVADALDVDHVDLPLAPERIWRLVQ